VSEIDINLNLNTFLFSTGFMKNVIFLDIDGVLQPINSRDRFEHDADALKKQFSEELDPILATVHPLDVAAVYYDWHKPSVEYLRTLCIDHQAAIVISSNWRYYQTFEQLLGLFHIHQLHDYVKDVTIDITGKRPFEIKEFLDRHPGIEKFVIFDDLNFNGMIELFSEQFILCRDRISEQDFLKAAGILSGSALG
jgi:HAD domain in Swiss Army Knife RNA repair proteins